MAKRSEGLNAIISDGASSKLMLAVDLNQRLPHYYILLRCTFAPSTDKKGALLLQSLIDLGMYSRASTAGYASLIPNFVDGNNGSSIVDKVYMVHIV